MIDIIKNLSKEIFSIIINLAEEHNVELDEKTVAPVIEYPKDKSHGDIACTAALRLAKTFRQPPCKIGEMLMDKFQKNTVIQSMAESIEIAGPGFINFFLSKGAVFRILNKILETKEEYGKNNLLQDQKIILEFVSANPTGPLNAVNARSAAVGDVLANILEKSSAKVHREFYVNDCGNQIELLGKSLKLRYKHLLGNEIDFPENGYHGEYLIDMAKDLILKYGDSLIEKDTAFFSAYAVKTNLSHQKKALEQYNVKFDKWFSEKSLHKQKMLEHNLAILEKNGFVYEEDGKKWFTSTRFADDKDRVLKRDNGIPTYFMADTAYHNNKYERGFNRLIDIWGPDHHGYIPRLAGAMQAMGHAKDSFTVLIVQQVNLLKDGQPYKMSKRAGRFILMQDVIDEVGADAARFFFVMRTSDSQLDFDLDLAKKHTADNPCFYVQYAHARIHSIYAKFKTQYPDKDIKNLDFSAVKLLNEPEELALIKKMGQFPQIIASCAESLDIHHLPYYLYDLSAIFHNYYNLGKENANLRIITDDLNATQARMALITGIRIILHEGLSLLGINAPESM
ncbi:arginine--tRNA ligase [bacterium]|nr:arginine--tRNA ligase [bacterium]